MTSIELCPPSLVNRKPLSGGGPYLKVLQIISNRLWGGEQSIFSIIIREVALLPFSKLFPSLGHNNIDEKFLKKVVK